MTVEQRGNTLGTARLIATVMYAGPLVVLPWVGRFATAGNVANPKVLGVLVPVLVFVAVTDYVISLLVEAKVLAQARDVAGPKKPVITAAAVTSAFGASLAVYGLVVTMLGAAAWGAAFYVLCAVHGLHLMIRWPRYAAAAEPE
jgi:hypothetical protein